MEQQSQAVLERERIHRDDHKIFDEQASIRMIQEDLQRFDQILPETWQQIYNEELTFVAEAINAPLHTKFKLQRTDQGLVDERGNLLIGALNRGRIAAEQAAEKDERLAFNVRRAVLEHEEGVAIERMMTSNESNTIVSVSPFSEEAHRRYGDEVLESIGMQPKRKLGFIRIYQKLSDTELNVISVSVDNSDPVLFSRLLMQMGVRVPVGISSDELLGYRYEGQLDGLEQELLPEELRLRYDRELARKYGGEFKAGRRSSGEIDAWKFIESQKDLVEYYFTELELLARNDPDNLRAKRKLAVGFWSTLKERLEFSKENGMDSATPRYIDDEELRRAFLQQEVEMNYRQSASRHEQMVGCGGRIGQDPDILEEGANNALSSVMDGNESERKNWKWKQGICVVPRCPTRPGTTKVGPCSVCSCCQLEFDKGKDPVKMYKYMNN